MGHNGLEKWDTKFHSAKVSNMNEALSFVEGAHLALDYPGSGHITDVEFHHEYTGMVTP